MNTNKKISLLHGNPQNTALYQPKINSLKLYTKGKVRDNYIVDDNCLLMVTSDRISAFDINLSEAIPSKGRILCTISKFWFKTLEQIIPNHLIDIAPETVVNAEEISQIEGRAVVVKRLKPVLIEAVVRGYLTGSAWQQYKLHGNVNGLSLPQGLQFGDKLPEPIFTPTTKAPAGAHDENISFAQTEQLIGSDLAKKIHQISIKIYSAATTYAKKCGFIIVDTKFEFGQDTSGNLYLIDEVLTPDSSRFWWHPNALPEQKQIPLDKQFVRDWLNSKNWNRAALAPSLPKDIIEKLTNGYSEVLKLLTTNKSFTQSQL